MQKRRRPRKSLDKVAYPIFMLLFLFKLQVQEILTEPWRGFSKTLA